MWLVLMLMLIEGCVVGLMLVLLLRLLLMMERVDCLMPMLLMGLWMMQLDTAAAVVAGVEPESTWTLVVRRPPLKPATPSFSLSPSRLSQPMTTTTTTNPTTMEATLPPPPLF